MPKDERRPQKIVTIALMIALGIARYARSSAANRA